MSHSKDGGPAFPVKNEATNNYAYSGMTLHDWLIGQALAGNCGYAANETIPVDVFVKEAFAIADETIKQRGLREIQ